MRICSEDVLKVVFRNFHHIATPLSLVKGGCDCFPSLAMTVNIFVQLLNTIFATVFDKINLSIQLQLPVLPTH